MGSKKLSIIKKLDYVRLLDERYFSLSSDELSRFKEDLKYQFSSDLSNYLNNEDNIEKNIQNLVSKKVFEHKQNLKRYLSETGSMPRKTTIYKFYSHLFQANSLDEIALKANPIIKYALSYYFQTSDQTIDIIGNDKLSELFSDNEAINFIFIKTRNGKIISKDSIKQKYGEFGIKSLKELIKNKIVKSTPLGFTSDKSTICYDHKQIKSLALRALKDHYNSFDTQVNGEAYSNLYLSRLNRNEYFKLIELAQEFDQKKKNFLMNVEGNGDIHIATYSFTHKI